jgi:hypothetical protein
LGKNKCSEANNKINFKMLISFAGQRYIYNVIKKLKFRFFLIFFEIDANIYLPHQKTNSVLNGLIQ